MTKVKVPAPHFQFFRKLHSYLHHTLSLCEAPLNTLDFSKQLLDLYLENYLKAAKSGKIAGPALELQDKREIKKIIPPAVSPLHKFYRQLSTCQRCFLAKDRKHFLLPRPPAEETSTAPIVIMVDLPSFYDQTQKRHLSDNVGVLLLKILNALKLPLQKNYFTAAIKCASTIEVSNQLHKITPCLSHLKNELSLVKPSLIIAFGADCYRFLFPNASSKTPFNVVRGKLLTLTLAQATPCLFTHHPRELLHNPLLKKQTWQDLKPHLPLFQKLCPP